MNRLYEYSTLRARGSVMVLVVAVLGLLAVLGTVYLVSARTDRNTAAAMSTVINLKLAQDAVMTQVQQTIGSTTVDGTGSVGGYTANATSAAARLFDYPEMGTTKFGETDWNANVKDEPWLVSKLHRQVSGDPDLTILTQYPFDPTQGTYSAIAGIPGATGSPHFNQFAYASNTDTVVADQTATAIDNPATDKDDSPQAIADAVINLLPFSDASGIRYRFGVRIIDTNRMANLNTGSTYDGVDTIVDSTGNYLSSMRLAPNTGGAVVLPATNYYFNVADSTSNPLIAGRLHLNTSNPILGRTLAASTYSDYTNNSLWQQYLLRIEAPTDLNVSLFGLSDELELRSYGEFGTPFHARPAVANSVANIMWPNTLSADSSKVSPSTIVQGNPSRRNYTTYSFSREMRAFSDPVTAGSTAFTMMYGAGTYADTGSFAAPSTFPTDYGATVSPVQAPQPVNPNTIANVWPTIPYNTSTSAFYNTPYPQITFASNVTPESTVGGQTIASPSKANWTSMYSLAMTATNIATAMERVGGFSHRETVSFAANYITSAWNGIMIDPAVFPNSAKPYYFPGGPSFIDANGICVRTSITQASAAVPIGAEFGTATGAAANATDLASADTGNVSTDTYLGFTAQPFIYMVAMQSSSDGTGTNTSITMNDGMIVLYNPYLIPLSMNGYDICDMTSGAPVNILSLTHDPANNLYVPSKGFLVITTGTGASAFTAPSGNTQVVVAQYSANDFPNFPMSAALGQHIIALRRPYYPRGSAVTSMAVVDEFTYNGQTGSNANKLFPDPATSVAVPGTIGYEVRGDVEDANSGNPVDPSVTPYTFPNPTAVSTKGYLVDRTVTSGTPNALGVTPILALSDLNSVMRISNSVAPVTGLPSPMLTPMGLLTSRIASVGATKGLAANTDNAPGNPGNLSSAPTENVYSVIYFDFWVNPAIFSAATTPKYPWNIQPSTSPIPPDATGNSDTRAYAFLQCLTGIDRYSDTTIKIGSPTAIDKLRLPGKINLNTASGDVIRALPGLSTTNITSAQAEQIVANILAYRARKDVSVVPYGAATNNASYLQATYSGNGFRSVAEAMIPVFDALFPIGSPPPTLAARDKVWDTFCNLCTVRSDTFCVYGYLEAVRTNPYYTGAFANDSSWYATSVTDNPSDTTTTGVPLLRVSRRRWIAIVDRSWCNYSQSETNFTLPRIVAIKDLGR